jgi:hypothetical protein
MKQRIQINFRHSILLKNSLRNQMPLPLFLRLQKEIEVSIGYALSIEIKFPLINSLKGP